MSMALLNYTGGIIADYQPKLMVSLTHTVCLTTTRSCLLFVYFPNGVFYGNTMHGCSSLRSCRMLIFFLHSICIIDLISILIRANQSITNISLINLTRDFVLVSTPTMSTLMISNKMVKYAHQTPLTKNQHVRYT